MNPKIRNSVAEAISLLGISIAAIPQLQTVMHLPAWIGAVGALIITIGNQWLKDSNPPPTSVTVVQSPPSVASPSVTTGPTQIKWIQ